MSTGKTRKRVESALKFIDEADEELELNIPDPEAEDPSKPLTPVQRARLALHWAAEDLRLALTRLGHGPA